MSADAGNLHHPVMSLPMYDKERFHQHQAHMQLIMWLVFYLIVQTWQNLRNVFIFFVLLHLYLFCGEKHHFLSFIWLPTILNIKKKLISFWPQINYNKQIIFGILELHKLENICQIYMHKQ